VNLAKNANEKNNQLENKVNLSINIYSFVVIATKPLAAVATAIIRSPRIMANFLPILFK
jgi:hypothetical protein